MMPSRREFLVGTGALVASVSPSLAAWSRSRAPRGGSGRRRVGQADAWLLWRGPPGGFYLRITRGRRQELWEIFADAECTERLAGEIFTWPGLPRMVVVHRGLRLDVGETADGWLHTQVCRRRGLRDELLDGRSR